MTVPRFIQIVDTVNTESDDNILFDFTGSVCSEYGDYDWESSSRITVENRQLEATIPKNVRIKSRKNASDLKNFRKQFARSKRNKIIQDILAPELQPLNDDDSLNEQEVYFGDSFTEVNEILSIDTGNLDDVINWIDHCSEMHSVISNCDKWSSYSVSNSEDCRGIKREKRRGKRKKHRVKAATQIQALIRGYIQREKSNQHLIEQIKLLECKLSRINEDTKEELERIKEEKLQLITAVRNDFFDPCHLEKDRVYEELELISEDNFRIIKEFMALNYDLIKQREEYFLIANAEISSKC